MAPLVLVKLDIIWMVSRCNQQATADFNNVRCAGVPVELDAYFAEIGVC
jgi:hypothetical protein